MLARDMARREPFFFLVDQGKHSVIRRHEMVPFARDQQRPAGRANARVDDDHVHRTGRKIGICLRNRQGSIEHIESLHRVADVDNFRLRLNRQDDAFHGADEMIVESEIGGQRDDGFLRHSSLMPGHTSPGRFFPKRRK